MKDKIHLIAGSYATGKNNGIYIYRFDQNTGESEFVSKTDVDNPSYHVFSKDGQFLYAVLENEEAPSYVNIFTYDRKEESLTQIDSVISGDKGSCYVTIDKDNKHVLTANYGGGSISVFDLDDNGQFYKMSQLIVFKGQGVHPERQNMPHIHCVEFSPDNKYLFATDLGTDKIYQMKINYDCRECETDFVIYETVKFAKVADGSGPRHIVFHPNGEYLYLINELSDTVVVFSYDGKNISQIQEIPAITNDAGGGGDIVITPDGKYLYGSVRLKDDGIAIFKVHPDNGTLEKIGYQLSGEHPRNLRITPNGKYLLASCRDSDVIEVYRINNKNGLLEKTENSIAIEKPSCIKFL